MQARGWKFYHPPPSCPVIENQRIPSGIVSKWGWFGLFNAFVHLLKYRHTSLASELFEDNSVPNYRRKIKWKALGHILVLWKILQYESFLGKPLSRWGGFGRFCPLVHFLKFGHTGLMQQLFEVGRELRSWGNWTFRAFCYELLLWQIL